MSLHFFGRLYLVTDRRGLSEGRFFDVIERAVQGGVSCVQLREKEASDADFLSLAHELKKRLQSRHVPLIINDRVDIALAVSAAGVHVGQNDVAVLQAREALGSQAIIGLSVETLNQAKAAEALPVDYIAASPVFLTPTKKDTAPPLGLLGLRQLCAFSSRPTIAIGGMSQGNVDSVMNQGAAGIALSSAIMKSADPYASAQAFHACIYTKLSKRFAP